MFKNYLKTAFRNLSKRKGFTIVNIIGLAIGISCCLLLFQYVSWERSYDSFAEGRQLFRLRLDSYQQGKLAWQAATCYPVTGPYMKKDYPEIEDFCRLDHAPLFLSNDAKQVKFVETKGYFADASAINLLNIHLQKGNPAGALSGVDKMIVSESMAKRYFGNEEAAGKILTVRDAHMVQHYEVTGVFKDHPANSHLVINYLVSYAALGKIKRLQGDTTNSTETQWGWYDFLTYIKLKPGTDPGQFEKKLPAFCRKYYPDLNWAKQHNAHDELHLIPVQDIHLYSNYYQEAEVNGSAHSVNFMFLAAIFILAIAWINYINLATARSVERAKEVGVRKVLGARRSGLIYQFLAESLMLNLAALLLALIAALALTPAFNRLSGHAISPLLFTMRAFYWLIFMVIFIAGTLLSGLYPAFVLSAYQPVRVLKGAFKNTAGGFALRRGLIILQFGASIGLIAGTIIVYRQVQFMLHQYPGFNMKQTLVLNGAASLNDSIYRNVYESFKTELLKQPGIQSVTASSSVMGQEISWTNDLKRAGSGEDDEKTYTVYNLGVDYEFIPSYQMKMLAGRNFSRDFRTDKNAAVLNESAAKLLGFGNAGDALNTKLKEGVDDTLTVIGVLADFHHLGLEKSIDPQLIMLVPDTSNYYSVKVSPANMPHTIETIKKIWNSYFSNDPFTYFFLDNYYNQQYQASSLFGRVFGMFAFLAIFIACFGLSGLSAYNILQRTKEIGIRKVMGASEQQLLYLLSKDFMLLVLVAFLIAAPISWWTMSNWLQGFPYRISLSIWVFILSGIVAGIIALVTISLQAIKAALANPVKSLSIER